MSNVNILCDCHSSWAVIPGFSWPVHNYFYMSEQLQQGNWSQTYNDGQFAINHFTTINEKRTSGLDFLDVQWECSKSQIFFSASCSHPWRKTVRQFTNCTYSLAVLNSPYGKSNLLFVKMRGYSIQSDHECCIFSKLPNTTQSLSKMLLFLSFWSSPQQT